MITTADTKLKRSNPSCQIKDEQSNYPVCLEIDEFFFYTFLTMNEGSDQVYKNLVLRKNLGYVVVFMIPLVTLSLILGATGLQGFFASSSPPILIHRMVSLVALVVTLFLLGKNRLKEAAVLIIAMQLAGIPVEILWAGEPTAVGLLIILAPAVLVIELTNLLSAGPRSRFLVGLAAIALFILNFLLHSGKVSPQGRAEYMTVFTISIFILGIVTVPSFAGAVSRSRLLKHLEGLAYQDLVTGLPNSHQLVIDLGGKLQHHREKESDLMLLGLHIRGMERINQQLGFQGGEKMIREVGERLSGLRSRYEIYRIAGADFALLVRGDFSIQAAQEASRELLGLLEFPLKWQDEAVHLSGHVVGTVGPRDGNTAQRLILNIMNTLNNVQKNDKIAGIYWYDPADFSRMERQFLLEQMIPSSLKQHGFSYNIQPKLDLTRGTIMGGEVLARWHHPELGTISPGEFIPLIENLGLMVPFTMELLSLLLPLKETACHDRGEPLSLAVNVSASSLSDQDLVKALKDFSRKFAPCHLEIEITEDVFLAFNDKLLQTLKNLKKFGIGLALDDFGTGFSNMQYLQQIDVDVLKIDRSFIFPLPHDVSSAEIVRAVITMAHAFGIKVVAEGAETAEQVELLKNMGCDIIQGYAVSRPVSSEVFTRMKDQSPSG